LTTNLLILVIFVETDSATPGELDLDGLAEKAYTSQLISQLTCKVCLSDLVAIIFLPCGHCGKN